MPLGLFKHLDQPWEQARGPLRSDLDTLESSFNQLENELSSAPASSSVIQRARITLSHEQMLVLPSTYLLAVSAPKPNQYHVVHRWAMSFSVGSAYTNVYTADSQGGFSVAYGDWVDDASTFFPLWGLTQANSARQYLGTGTVIVPDAVALAANYPPLSGGPNGIAPIQGLPLKLIAWNAGLGNFTGGGASNAGRLTVYYTTEDM